jgi:phosphatidate cytidylyltransferase
MKQRLLSSAVLVLVLAGTLALDRQSATAWFSALLIAVLLALGAGECHALLRLRDRPPAGWGRALQAAAIVGLPGAFLLALRMQAGGLLLVLYVVAVAKMTDNGALFIGRQWGRRKLAPQISPGKTVAGLWGGLAVGTLTAVALAPLCTGRSILFSLLGGLLLSILAVLGDLAESLLKRRAGVKDSGALLPGIGGVLDLLDSILLSAPAAYLLLAWL